MLVRIKIGAQREFKKKQRLGKGLSALFGEQKSVEKSTKIEANSQNALIGTLLETNINLELFLMMRN